MEQEIAEETSSTTPLLNAEPTKSNVNHTITEVDEYDTIENDEGSNLGESRNLPWPERRKHIIIALAAYFIHCMGQLTVAASALDIAINIICVKLFPGTDNFNLIMNGQDPRCRGEEVAGGMSNFQSIDNMIMALTGLLIVPKLTGLTDRFGRKPLLILAGITYFIGDIGMTLSAAYPARADISWLYLCTFIKSICGSFFMIQLIFATYITDLTRPEERTEVLGFLDASLYGAMCFGPGLGSVVLRQVGSISKLFSMCLGLDALFLLAVLCLKESRSKKELESSIKVHNEEVQSRPLWEQYMEHLNIFRPLYELSFSHLSSPVSKFNVRLAVITNAITVGVLIGISQVLLLFAEFKFKMTSADTGFMLSVFGMGRTGVMLVIFPLLVSWFTKRMRVNGSGIDHLDLRFMRIGAVVQATGIFFLGRAPTKQLYVAMLPYLSLSGVETPIYKNVIIKYTEKTRIGEVLGGLGLLFSLNQLIGTQIFLYLFKNTIGTAPSLAFDLASAVCIVLFVLTWLYKVRDDDEDEVTA